MFRRVKENEQKKREAKEKGVKVTCKRMVSNEVLRNSNIVIDINSLCSHELLTGLALKTMNQNWWNPSDMK